MELNTRNGKLELNLGDLVWIDSSTFPELCRVVGFDKAPLDNGQRVAVKPLERFLTGNLLVDAFFGEIVKVDGFKVKKSVTRSGRDVWLVLDADGAIVGKFWLLEEVSAYIKRVTAKPKKASPYSAEVLAAFGLTK